jgi:hypothetical protein
VKSSAARHVHLVSIVSAGGRIRQRLATEYGFTLASTSTFTDFELVRLVATGA